MSVFMARGRWIRDRILTRVRQIVPGRGRKGVTTDWDGVHGHLLQSLFFTLGWLAKADGSVKKSEIQFTQSIMQLLHLTEQEQEAAIQRFNQGKNAKLKQAKGYAEQLHQACPESREYVLKMALEVLMQLCYVDSAMNKKELSALLHLVDALGLSRQSKVMHNRAQHEYAHRGSLIPQHIDVLKLYVAHGVLTVAETAAMTEIKQAYRRLMSQYHPDKLIAQGASDEAVKQANERSQIIKSAYELVRQARQAQ